MTGLDGSLALVKWCNHERRVPSRELMHLKERRATIRKEKRSEAKRIETKGNKLESNRTDKQIIEYNRREEESNYIKLTEWDGKGSTHNNNNEREREGTEIRQIKRVFSENILRHVPYYQ